MNVRKSKVERNTESAEQLFNSLSCIIHRESYVNMNVSLLLSYCGLSSYEAAYPEALVRVYQKIRFHITIFASGQVKMQYFRYVYLIFKRCVLLRSSLWDIMQRILIPMYRSSRTACLPLEDGTNKLPCNVGRQLQTYAA